MCSICHNQLGTIQPTMPQFFASIAWQVLSCVADLLFFSQVKHSDKIWKRKIRIAAICMYHVTILLRISEVQLQLLI